VDPTLSGSQKAGKGNEGLGEHFVGELGSGETLKSINNCKSTEKIQNTMEREEWVMQKM
jgi:hypothetical protein